MFAPFNWWDAFMQDLGKLILTFLAIIVGLILGYAIWNSFKR